MYIKCLPFFPAKPKQLMRNALDVLLVIFAAYRQNNYFTKTNRRHVKLVMLKIDHLWKKFIIFLMLHGFLSDKMWLKLHQNCLFN